jgi:hypothetical protein
LDFSVDLILPGTLWSGVDRASNRVPGTFLGLKRGQHVRLTTSSPSESRMP